MAKASGWRWTVRDAKRRDILSGDTKFIPTSDGLNLVLTINEAVQLDGLNLAIREAGKWTDFSEKAVLQTLAGTYDNQSMFEFMGLFPSLTGNNTLDLQGTYMSGLIADCVTEGSMGAGAALAISNFGESVVSQATVKNLGGEPNADQVATARAI